MISRNGRRKVFKAAFVGCALLVLGGISSAETDEMDIPQDDEQATAEDTNTGVDYEIYSEFPYPDEGQPHLGPTDVEELLNRTVPKKDAIFGDVVLKRYSQWKQDLYNNYNLKLGTSFQSLYQVASETAPFGTFDTAWGYWFGIAAKWTPLNKAEDYEGSLVIVAGARGSIGDNAVPAEFGQGHVGSLWPTNFGSTSWPFAIEELYWEQWLGKDRLMLRAGTMVAASALNLFRFKDDRTSFTGTPFAFHTSIPSGAQGPAIAARWWPVKNEDSELYLTGVIADVNGNPNDGFAGLDFGSFAKGEWFYSVEIGKYWRRDGGEFDHVWIDLFYADERSTRDPDVLPNEAGGGFKLMGSKQHGQWVGFGSYTYNTAEGGATSVGFGRHTVTAGGAYLSPLGIRGEIGTGLVWMEPHPELLGPDIELRNQTGFEAYWKLLVTPNLWVTPGFQFIMNPSLNPSADSVFIPHIKFRLAY